MQKFDLIAMDKFATRPATTFAWPSKCRMETKNVNIWRNVVVKISRGCSAFPWVKKCASHGLFGWDSLKSVRHTLCAQKHMQQKSKSGETCRIAVPILTSHMLALTWTWMEHWPSLHWKTICLEHSLGINFVRKIDPVQGELWVSTI